MRLAIRKVLSTLIEAGYEAYIVGGYVRDVLLGRETNDCDITTSATPDQVEQLFEQVHSQAKQHGTIGVVCEGELFEVTSFRSEGTYDDFRRPSSVTFTTSLSEDLSRRDFTINALAMNLAGEITDLYGGQADMEASILRVIGDPLVRFREDALRILRALRFQSQLGFQLEDSLVSAIKQCAPLVAHLSLERVCGELTKLLAGEHVLFAIEQYNQLQLPGLPQTLIARSELSLVEQCACAHWNEGFDASRFPWTKEERALYAYAQQLPNTPPTNTQLYQMRFAKAMIRIGGIVHHWNETLLNQAYKNLVIHSRSELPINGHDLLTLGYQGAKVEEVFVAVESAVVEGHLANEQPAILSWIKEHYDEHH
jgi:tRNA nucleotidyltransferase (CCA-adding enzyme)